MYGMPACLENKACLTQIMYSVRYFSKATCIMNTISSSALRHRFSQRTRLKTKTRNNIHFMVHMETESLCPEAIQMCRLLHSFTDEKQTTARASSVIWRFRSYKRYLCNHSPKQNLQLLHIGLHACELQVNKIPIR